MTDSASNPFDDLPRSKVLATSTCRRCELPIRLSPAVGDPNNQLWIARDDDETSWVSCYGAASECASCDGRGDDPDDPDWVRQECDGMGVISDADHEPAQVAGDDRKDQTRDTREAGQVVESTAEASAGGVEGGNAAAGGDGPGWYFVLLTTDAGDDAGELVRAEPEPAAMSVAAHRRADAAAVLDAWPVAVDEVDRRHHEVIGSAQDSDANAACARAVAATAKAVAEAHADEVASGTGAY